MQFLIIAIDHNWQLEPYAPETPERTAEKTRLAELLNKAIAEQGVDLICEESNPCNLSVAQKIAYGHAPRIAWKNIIMSAQERLEAGIYEALLNRPKDMVEEPPGSGCCRTIDHRIPEDDIRERFFAAEAIETERASGARSVLILCGDMHADFLKRILRASQYQAEVNRSLIPQTNWQG